MGELAHDEFVLAARLLGDLTSELASALHATCRTEEAAVTALLLHLNLTPISFGLLRMRDVAPDGAAVRGPTTSPDWPAYQTGSRYTRAFAVLSLRPGDEIPWNEFSCRELVVIPDHAQAIFAAHRAYRVRQGATNDDPYFAHPQGPPLRSEQLLREAIRRTCHKLGIGPAT